MLRFVSSLLLSLLAASSLLAAWQHLPVGNFPVTAIATDSSGNRCVLLDGLWQTMDNGVHWTSLRDRLSEISGIPGAVKVVDANADTILVTDWMEMMRGGTVGPSIVSYDGGVTWHEIPGAAGNAFAGLTVWNVRHNVWFYADAPQFYRSEDYGATWTAAGTGPGAVRQIKQIPYRDSTLLVIGDSRSFWQSDDLGTTWRQMLRPHDVFGPDIEAFVHDFVLLSDGTHLALCGNPGATIDSALLVRSTDGGQTWARFSSLAGHRGEYRRIHEDYAHGGTVYLLTDKPGGVLRSTDYGETWQPSLSAACGSSGINLYQNTYSNTVYAMLGDGGVFQTDDGGDSWQAVPLPPFGAGGSTFTVSEQAVTSGRQWLLESPWSEWQRICPLPYRQDTLFVPILIRHVNGSTLVGQIEVRVLEPPYNNRHYYMVASSDNGATWTIGPESPCEVLEPLDSESRPRLLGRPQESQFPFDSLYASDDLGQSWYLLPHFPAPYGLNDDFGWEIAQSETEIFVLSRAWQDGEREAVFQYVRPSASWRLLNSHVGFRWHNLIADGPWVFVADSVDHVMRFWTDSVWGARGPLPAEPLRQFTVTAGVPHRMVGLFGDARQIWSSDDYGATWIAHAVDLPPELPWFNLYDLTFDRFRHRVWASSGIGPCYIDIAELDAGERPIHVTPSDYSLLRVSPNPFNATTTLSYILDKTSPAELSIYNTLGQRLAVLTSGVQNAGEHELLWDASGFSSGIYFARLSAGAVMQSKKMILLK